MDEEALQRRRELMRQKALAKAQIGIGQEEILVSIVESCIFLGDEEATRFFVSGRIRKRKSLEASMRTMRHLKRKPLTPRMKERMRE